MLWRARSDMTRGLGNTDRMLSYYSYRPYPDVFSSRRNQLSTWKDLCSNLRGGICLPTLRAVLLRTSLGKARRRCIESRTKISSVRVITIGPLNIIRDRRLEIVFHSFDARQPCSLLWSRGVLSALAARYRRRTRRNNLQFPSNRCHRAGGFSFKADILPPAQCRVRT